MLLFKTFQSETFYGYWVPEARLPEKTYYRAAVQFMLKMQVTS